MLFLDVETNGIGKFRPPTQRIVQIAWILNGVKKSYFVNDVEEVSDQVPHPYNVSFLRTNGNSFINAITDFMEDIKKCKIIVAHNSDFDIGCIKYELFSRGFDEEYHKILDFKKVLCTMKSSVYYCKIPFDKPRPNIYKWPKLEELYNKIFKRKPDIILHDALNDCIVTRKCVRSLLNNNALKL